MESIDFIREQITIADFLESIIGAVINNLEG